MRHERLIKSSSRKLGAILTVSSLLMVNLLSPVVVLAQNIPDIHLEKGDFVHNPEDIELPNLLDLGEHIDLTMFEVEKEHFDLSNFEEPNPTSQMEVEVGTFEELQRVIDEAVPDTALVITITESFAFHNAIFLQGGLDITLQSDGDYTLTQRNGRHFIVHSNSALTLRDGITLDGASQAGGIEVIRSMFTMEGGHITNNKSLEYGGGIYSVSGVINITGGSIEGNSAENGGGLFIMYGETNITGGLIAYNEAYYSGGGIFVGDGTVDITNTTIAYNQGSYAGGGLLMIEGTVEMDYARINYNEAENGGGLYLAGVTTRMWNQIRIENNSAHNIGGGMYIYSGYTYMYWVNTINNSADFGGGIFLAEGATAYVIDIYLFGNKARTAGGGWYIYNAELNLRRGIITENSAEAGGAIYINNGDFEMGSGAIFMNEAFQGGGVVVGDHATFTLRWGVGIFNNRADIDCNVRVYPTGTFNNQGGNVGGC